MSAVRLLAAVLVTGVVSVHAAAEPWRSAATGPAGLPHVEVEAGYPGNYVPAVNAPLVLRIRSGARPFDGYVGYHIAEGARKTSDDTVLTRVSMGARSERLFRSWLSTGAPQPERELVIGWYDRSGRRIATISAGRPPWQQTQRLILPFSTMSSEPQWYTGFRQVITPIDHWFELPLPVREAIFHSMVHVVFIGPPSRVPPMHAIDRALLPIEIQDRPGRIDPPWPYAAEKREVTVSWVAKPGTHALPSDGLPFVVRSGIASYVADQSVLRYGLPRFRSGGTLVSHGERVRLGPRPVELLREMRPLLAVVLIAPLGIIGWIGMRRRPRWGVPLLLIAAAATVLFMRDSIMSFEHTAQRIEIKSPEVFDTRVSRRDAGAQPLPASPSWGRQWVSTGEASHRTEVRESGMLPGFGGFLGTGWLTAPRVAKKRELGSPAEIRSRITGPGTLEVEYVAPFPIHYVRAVWDCGGKRCVGTSPAAGRPTGRVTVRHAIETWACLSCRLNDLYDQADVWTAGVVSLFHVTAARTLSIRQISEGAAKSPMVFGLMLEPSDSKLVGSFVLSEKPTPDLQVSIVRGGMHKDTLHASLRGPAGTLRIEETPFVSKRGELARIAPSGGVITVTVERSTATDVPVGFDVKIAKGSV